jgi:hypothetical protein
MSGAIWEGGGGVNYEEEGKQRLGINDQHHI